MKRISPGGSIGLSGAPRKGSVLGSCVTLAGPEAVWWQVPPSLSLRPPPPPRPRGPQFLLQDCASCLLSSAGHCGFLVPLQLRIRPNPERPRAAPAPPVPECLPGAFRQQTATAGVALVARERLPRTCSPLRLPRSTPDGHARPPGTFVNALPGDATVFCFPQAPVCPGLFPTRLLRTRRGAPRFRPSDSPLSRVRMRCLPCP